MQRKTLWIAAGAAGILVVGRLIQIAGQAERAAELSERAARLLHPPFDEAPTFADLRAAEARLLVEDARELDSSEETRRLWVEARAIEHLQRGAPDQARRELETAFPVTPPELRLLEAGIEFAAQRLPEAEELLKPLLRTESPELRVLALASDLARAQGRADRALELAERGLAASSSAAMHERRGLAHELAGDLPAARDDLAKAAQLDPRPSGPLLHLGRVQRALGDLRAAVLAFQGAAHRNPREHEAWLGSGICRMALGDHAGARVDLERAEELAPTRAAPLIALGDVDVAEHLPERAEGRYRAATQLEPELALGWLKLGNTLMRRGQPAEAATAYRRAIARQDEFAAAHNGLGAALLASGEPRQAQRELERAAELDPRDPNPLMNLARLHRRQGDFVAAESALLQAHARAPELADSANAH